MSKFAKQFVSADVAVESSPLQAFDLNLSGLGAYLNGETLTINLPVLDIDPADILSASGRRQLVDAGCAIADIEDALNEMFNALSTTITARFLASRIIR